jgi:hypothetical protein
MKVLWKKIVAALLLALVAASGVFAFDPVAFVGLENYGVRFGRNPGIRIIAKGKDVTSYPVASRTGGVLFQSVAIPATGFEGMPVSIEYRPERPDGQRLAVTIGNTALTADIYDWMLIPTARFAATEYTACMTLFGFPVTDEEVELYLDDNMFLVEFHPDFTNTLIGMNLFFVDSMLVDLNINRMRLITNTLSGIIPGYNDISVDEKESTVRAAYIRNLLLRNWDGWDNYIYTDYGTDIRYGIADGKLVFTGYPSYLFMQVDENTETVRVSETINSLIRLNIQRVRAINPVIYRAAEQTSQWAAFFRMVKEQYPQVWESFIAQISGVQTDVQIETPRSWRRN